VKTGNLRLNDTIGKEVIDESGDQVGIVKDVEWNPQSKMVEYILLAEGGISAKLGLGDKKLVPIDMVENIGEKVMIKGILFKAD
jgi:sporulation protein YlmC with PRC-barrel domain